MISYGEISSEDKAKSPEKDIDSSSLTSAEEKQKQKRRLLECIHAYHANPSDFNFESLLHAVNPMMMKTLNSFDGQTAMRFREDLLQEMRLALFRSVNKKKEFLEEEESVAKFLGYLRISFRNAALDFLRREQGRQEIPFCEFENDDGQEEEISCLLQMADDSWKTELESVDPTLERSSLTAREKDLLAVLDSCDGNQSRAAKRLGISRQAVQKRIAKIRKKHGKGLSKAKSIRL